MPSRKGSPNKITAQIKDMVRQAIDNLGGVEYFMWAAKEEPRAFLGLVAKMMPAHLKAEIEQKGVVVVRDYSGQTPGITTEIPAEETVVIDAESTRH